jgi:urea transport system substrate-binding protein
MEAAYFGVGLWAQAVRDAASDDAGHVRNAIANQTLRAPEGMVYVDPENHHTWKTVRIGRIKIDGQFEIVWSSQRPIRPVPYPIYRSPSEWEQFLDALYNKWGQSWSNPRGE